LYVVARNALLRVRRSNCNDGDTEVVLIDAEASDCHSLQSRIQSLGTPGRSFGGM